MPGKRRMIVNGIVVSVETPSARGGRGIQVEQRKVMVMSYSQAIEHWGGALTSAIWQKLDGDTDVRVTHEQFAALREQPDVRDAEDVIEDIVGNSRCAGA